MKSFALVLTTLVATLSTVRGVMHGENWATKQATGTSGTTINRTVVGIIEGDPGLAEWSALIDAAGLVDTLEGAGPFTIFSPTNEGLMMQVNLTILMDPQWQPHLRKILSYHVVQDVVSSDSLVAGTSWPTLEGSTFNITSTDSQITINGHSNLMGVDVIGTNGIVHVIDQVLLPPFVFSSVVDLVESLPQEFSIFVDLLSLAGLTDEDGLAGPGPFTVFAPTNAAFSKLGQAKLEELTSLDGADDLKATLLYHVIPAIVMSDDMAVGETKETLNGDTLEVTSLDPVTLDGSATITDADTLVANGVVHVVDTVLIPGEPVFEDGEMGLSNVDLYTFVSLSSNHTVFADLLDTAGFHDILSKHYNDSAITLFAPDNQAFDDFGDIKKYYKKQWNGHLMDLLFYHMIDHPVYTSDMKLGTEFAALNYAVINVTSVDPDIILNYDTELWESDINASNGVMHVVDQVLLPPSAMYDIIELAQMDSEFSVLLQLLADTNLTDKLHSEGPFTLFAPTNAAFEKLDPDYLESLTTTDEGLADLTTILEYHLVHGILFDTEIEDGSVFATLAGPSITISAANDTEGYLAMTVNNIMTEETNVLATNGLFHVIDTILLPTTIEWQAVDQSTPSVNNMTGNVTGNVTGADVPAVTDGEAAGIAVDAEEIVVIRNDGQGGGPGGGPGGKNSGTDEDAFAYPDDDRGGPGRSFSSSGSSEPLDISSCRRTWSVVGSSLLIVVLSICTMI